MPGSMNIEWLSKEEAERVAGEAAGILEAEGFTVESEEALGLLAAAGAVVEGPRARIPEQLLEESLKDLPDNLTLYDTEGNTAAEIGGDTLCFNPGSSAVRILDRNKGESREPVTRDLIEFAILTDSLKGYEMQSTALVPADIPQMISDSYRLYLALQYSAKPVVTGTFAKEGFGAMRRMLEVAAGGRSRLREKPLAIFDCCPTSPLRWSGLTADALIGCARAGIPAEIVPMPLAGATSPATLAGTIVQHCAENLSGVVIHQLACPGAPVIYGGSPAYFDMREGTTPVSGVEAVIINGANACMAKYFGMPSHAYMALSDSKSIGYEAGAETGFGAAAAAMSGVNNVSGPGMSNFQTCQSFEKLIIDNEISLMAKRLRRGVDWSVAKDTPKAIAEGVEKGSFLALRHTLSHFREEGFFPGEVIDRSAGEKDVLVSESAVVERARVIASEIIKRSEPRGVDTVKREALSGIMKKEAERAGLDRLPGTR